MLVVILILLNFSQNTFGQSTNLCEVKGGTSIEFNCYCPLARLFIHPNSQSCFGRNLQILESFHKSRWDCPVKSSLTRTTSGPQKISCEDPASSICNPKNNRPLVQWHWYEQDYYNTDAEVDDELVPFVRKVSKGKASYCWELDDSLVDECFTQKEKIFAKRIWDSDKYSELSRQWDNLKRSAVSYLIRKLKSLLQETPRNTESIEALQKSIDLAANATIPFDISYDIIGPNARAQISEGKSRHASCPIHGLINGSAISMKSTLLILAHELGHIVDTNTWIFNDSGEFQGVTSSPFKKELKCLAPMIRPPDIDCYKKSAENQENPQIKSLIDKWLSLRDQFPYLDFPGRASSMGKICQNSQTQETTADFLGTEFLMEMMGPQNIQPLSILDIQEITASLCTSIIDSRYKSPFQNKNQKKILEAGRHPKLKSRLNNIILQHPAMRKALGCHDLENEGKYCGQF